MASEMYNLNWALDITVIITGAVIRSTHSTHITVIVTGVAIRSTHSTHITVIVTGVAIRSTHSTHITVVVTGVAIRSTHSTHITVIVTGVAIRSTHSTHITVIVTGVAIPSTHSTHITVVVTGVQFALLIPLTSLSLLLECNSLALQCNCTGVQLHCSADTGGLWLRVYTGHAEGCPTNVTQSEAVWTSRDQTCAYHWPLWLPFVSWMCVCAPPRSSALYQTSHYHTSSKRWCVSCYIHCDVGN